MTDEYVVPILPSRDLHETLAFYQRLGFRRLGPEIETYRYLIVSRGGAIELHFFDAPGIDPLTTDGMCFVNVRDVDALYREWSEIGVPTDPATGSRIMPPVDTDYGMREFAVVDPSGNLVRVASPL